MPQEFQYDVFLSHSAKDKAVVRCFIPLRLDDTLIKGSLAQFLCINWRLADRDQESFALSHSFIEARCCGPI